MFYFFGQRKLRLSGGAVRPALPREPQGSEPLHDPRTVQILRGQLQSLTEDRDRWAARACAAEERLAVRERDGGAVRSLIAAWREAAIKELRKLEASYNLPAGTLVSGAAGFEDFHAQGERDGIPRLTVKDVVSYVNPTPKMTAAEHDAWLKSLEAELRNFEILNSEFPISKP